MASYDKIIGFIDEDNIAVDLSEDKLIEIGSDAVEGYDKDKKSRHEWERDTEKWLKLATQVAEHKTFPWEGASNVKYPLVAVAAMQFSARAYPSLVPQAGNIVQCRAVGFDPMGEKANRAIRISKHMSYQIMEEMDEWEEDMDKLLLVMSIVGIAFKKTYFCPMKQRNVSKLIFADDLVVNNWTRSLLDAERITEVLYYSKRKVKEMQLGGLWRDVDLGEPTQSMTDMTAGNPQDATTPYTILEQHTFLDLDEDGYAEPYIVTVDYNSREVLRIKACYNKDNVIVDDEGKIIQIKPIQYYTKFGAIPNPTGSFYNIGFGHLLGPLNDSANTLINQLIDAGSLSNLQAGFIGKGLRMKMSESRFKPGEWKAVNATGDDIKKQIFPLPVREPSNVLFQLLGMLIQSGKELASVADIMVGKMPGQNTPAYTTKETVEQGMKLFTAIYKRVYRSLKDEFRKMYLLNRWYLNPQHEADILDIPVQQSDYEGSENDIVPGADPSAASQTEKANKVQQMFPLVQLGTLNPMELTKRMLEAQEQPDPEKLIAQPPPPQPDPKVEAMKMKAQQDQQKFQLETVKTQQDMQIKEREAQLNMQIKAMELKFKEMELAMNMQQKKMEAMFKLQMSAQDHEISKAIEGEKHAQKMQQDAEMFTFKAYEAAEKAKQAKEPKVREPKPPKK